MRGEQPISRRRFLHQAGGAVAAASLASQAGWFIGCAPRTRTAPDWGALSKRLGGTLVRPGNRLYDGASQPLNQRYASIRPQGVALCANAEDRSMSMTGPAR